MSLLADEHPMPSIEAMLAGTLALMTGYSQFLQAAANPAHRLSMGEKIARNLALLAEHPLLSAGCRCVLSALQERWAVMSSCTVEAASACGESLGGEGVRASGRGGPAGGDPQTSFTLPAPHRLQ